MSDLTQYGVAAVVTYLLLKEIFAFLLKMRAKQPNGNAAHGCGFDSMQQTYLSDIRDGINKLVTLAEK